MPFLVLAAFVLVAGFRPATASAGAVTHYYVYNNSAETVRVEIWTTTKEIKPGETAQFRYAVQSSLPGTVWKLNGTQTYHKAKLGWDWIPGDHSYVVQPDLTLKHLGRTKKSKVVEEGLKKAVEFFAKRYAEKK